MKISRTLLLGGSFLLGGFLLGSCDKISENKRLIPDPVNTPVNAENYPVILVEDYTGQKCVNCPETAKILHDLHEQYPENVVLVSVYDLGMSTEPMVTTEADELIKAFDLPSVRPLVMVNRTKIDGEKRFALDKVQLPTLISKAVLGEKQVSLELSVSRTEKEISVDMTSKAINRSLASTPLKLGLMVVENGIKAPQQRPDGIDHEYIHNHILRGTLTAPLGDAYTLGTNFKQTFPIPAKVADPANIKVIAFIADNTNRILEATEAK